MAAYEPELWHDFFVATAGAAAALTGLLFVAISINLQRIIELPGIPGRALCTLGVLVALLVVSCLALAPDQSTLALGIEVAVIGAIVATQSVVLFSRTERTQHEPRFARAGQLSLLVVPTGALVIGGVSVAAEAGGGLYWVLAGVVLGFLGAVVNSWVFLVEIQR